jgi:hypothetical protein
MVGVERMTLSPALSRRTTCACARVLIDLEERPGTPSLAPSSSGTPSVRGMSTSSGGGGPHDTTLKGMFM